MRRKMLLPAVLLSLSTGSITRAESQNFHLVDQSTTVDRVNKTASFSLTFDQQPSFVAIDNSQLEAFQYEIDTNTNVLGSTIPQKDVDIVIRGAEIWQGNGIPVRDSHGDGGEHAGGWGPVRAFVPFEVSDNTLSFTTTLANLGDTDGKFRYRVITTDDGGLTSVVQGAAIPLPTAAYSGFAMLGLLAVTLRFRRRVL
jgi:hypothetical protein